MAELCRALQNFERLARLLPRENQQELCQLLLRAVEGAPFEPEREAPQEAPPTASPDSRAGATAAERAFTTKSRPRWYRVRIALYQLPNLPSQALAGPARPASVNHAGGFSDKSVFGSPRRETSRTSSLNLTLLAGVTLAARGAARFAYHFAGAASPRCFAPLPGPARSSKQHRNPIAVAQEWQRALNAGACPSRAALARQLGVLRARVTQVLGRLELAPEVAHASAALGAPLPRPIISERRLRPLLKLSMGQQLPALRTLISPLHQVPVHSCHACPSLVHLLPRVDTSRIFSAGREVEQSTRER